MSVMHASNWERRFLVTLKNYRRKAVTMLSSILKGFLGNVSRKPENIRLNLGAVRLFILSSGVSGARFFLMNVRAKKCEK